MERKLIKTGDGSVTIHLSAWDEQYHSKYGAVQEAQHVFIKMGLEHRWEKFPETDLKILEIGFGTGLNAFITFLESKERSQEISYFGVEAYPIAPEEIKGLNYPEILKAEEQQDVFRKIHDSVWEEKFELSSKFSLTKFRKKFQEIDEQEIYNLIYFDAFGARVQPELWTENIFRKMYEALEENGVLVTYSAKGSVRRALQNVGFIVERLPGPPGKREMLRATKK